MTAGPLPGVIRRSALGEDLGEGDCKTLAGIMTVRTLADGEVLYEEGDAHEILFLLACGRLTVNRGVAAGEDLTLHVMHAGAIAGEMSFIDGTPHIATLRSAGKSEVYELRREDFEKLVETNPWLVHGVMRSIIRTVHATMLRMGQQFVELQNYVTKTHGRY
jgi:CRP-like cAMP-binding protein